MFYRSTVEKPTCKILPYCNILQVGNNKMKKIDWFQIITDLKNAGISGREIARRLNVSVSTVIMWKNGSSPSYEAGAKLITMWEKEKIE